MVEGAGDGPEVTGKNAVLDLSCQLFIRCDVLLRSLVFLAFLLEDLLWRELAAEIGIHVLFLELEACLDRLLARPVLSMRLALDEGSLGGHVSIPAYADSLGAFGLLQTALV